MISAYFSISQIQKPYEIRVFLGISPTFHQRVTFVALGSTGAPACNFAKQSSSSEWPSLPAPASGGWNDVEESSNKTTAACRFLDDTS